MIIFILDGLKMTDRQSAHRYIARIMHFPDYYGHNLDALYDCLGEYGSECSVIILNSRQMLENLQDYGKLLLETFRDAAAEPASFSLSIND